MQPRLPLPDERIYTPYKISALVEVLEAQGVSPAECLMGSGVEVDDLADPFAQTSIRQYMTVCANALVLSRDPATPFEAGTRLHVSAYGIYGYALLSCLSLRDYFRLAKRFRRLATPPMTVEWDENENEVRWFVNDVFVLNPDPALRQFLFEKQFSINVTHLQDVVGQPYPPLRACFSYPAPPHAELYARYLNCPCFFAQPFCELAYDRAILERKPVLAHPLTSVLVQETCDRLIGQTRIASGTAGSVYRLLMDRPGQFPDMEAAARMVNMTSRTLRRRLDAEATSFQAIRDEVRLKLAQEYLGANRMSLLDTAMLLGFSDVAGFRKALKRWTGKGPDQFRKSL
ncbi:AraC family transcriptional regulator [Pseudomonas sp.]|uniref:AraC family transcriptional regulator n=1 Tax=Pseudomonas sp. TaxID=306 RepID=UPI003A972210